MAIVGDAFAKPMLKALEEAEANAASRTTSRRLQLMISSGVMWSAEVKQGLMARGSFICFDSLGSSEGVGFASSISAPGAEQTTAKFTIGPQARRCSRRTATRSCPARARSACSPSAATSRSATTRTSPRRAATFQTINGKRWSVPGDFASVEADGTIVLLGRGSVVINSGGEKIYPEEVEEAVKRHPAVADCLVVGVPDERFGEAVTAVVSLAPGTAATGDEIGAALEALSRFKHPRHYVFVPEVAARARTARPTTSGPSRPPPSGAELTPEPDALEHCALTREGRRSRPSLAQLRAARCALRSNYFLLLAGLARPWRARRGALRIRTSSPSSVISVPPYFE